MVSMKAPFLVAATAFTATALSTDAQLILSDLRALDTSVLNLTSTIRSYNGGVLAGLPIELAISGVHLANRKTYYDAQLISNQSAADSFAVVEYVRNPIAVDIPDSVEVLKSKKALFVEAGLTGAVLSGLRLLKSDHDSLSEVLLEKVAPEAVVEGAYEVKVIDDAIQSGIDDFSS